MIDTFEKEIEQRERFEFGKNWQRFLSVLNENRIAEAEKSLKQMLEVEDLQGKSFLDIGSGSGLFSLAARRLGAKVYSFDYDTDSVACTQELKRLYFVDDSDWTVEEGSVLNLSYLQSLGKFDIVYSWGVLHHTGAMWKALENINTLPAENGKLFISIYNNQGRASNGWKSIKKLYNVLPSLLKYLVLYPSFIRLWLPSTIRDFITGKPFHTWKNYVASRGMSPWWDVVDWVGGYPFEVAKPEEIFDFYRQRGYRLEQLRTCAGGHGCNEFVFAKI
ncbi:MAG: class I SAM-dependent methyltransferase [Oscillatoria sp. SIO1A7]|nr:class I SAM-dependent methyltransferase [Oscillatoria sp. SIO1A7]